MFQNEQVCSDGKLPYFKAPVSVHFVSFKAKVSTSSKVTPNLDTNSIQAKVPVSLH